MSSDGHRSAICRAAIRRGNVTSAGWQVTLCDSMWHVSSRSGVATSRTAIHLLLTYLLTYYQLLYSPITASLVNFVIGTACIGCGRVYVTLRCLSVGPSVYPIYPTLQQRAAGLLLWVQRQEMSID